MNSSPPSDSLTSIVSRHQLDADAYYRELERCSYDSYEQALGMLMAALKSNITMLEKSKHNYKKASEDQISDFIVNGLVHAGFDARRGDASGGETDLKVVFHKVASEWLGEAKIWRKLDDAREGMLQLITRYCTGREQYVGLLIYCTTATVQGKVDEWKNTLPGIGEIGFVPESIADVEGWPLCFTSNHVHPDAGTELSTQHMFVNLIHNPQDKSARKAAERLASKEAEKAEALNKQGEEE